MNNFSRYLFTKHPVTLRKRNQTNIPFLNSNTIHWTGIQLNSAINCGGCGVDGTLVLVGSLVSKIFSFVYFRISVNVWIILHLCSHWPEPHCEDKSYCSFIVGGKAYKCLLADVIKLNWRRIVNLCKQRRLHQYRPQDVTCWCSQ